METMVFKKEVNDMEDREFLTREEIEQSRDIVNRLNYAKDLKVSDDQMLTYHVLKNGKEIHSGVINNAPDSKEKTGPMKASFISVLDNMFYAYFGNCCNREISTDAKKKLTTGKVFCAVRKMYGIDVSMHFMLLKFGDDEKQWEFDIPTVAEAISKVQKWYAEYSGGRYTAIDVRGRDIPFIFDLKDSGELDFDPEHAKICFDNSRWDNNPEYLEALEMLIAIDWDRFYQAAQQHAAELHYKQGYTREALELIAKLIPSRTTGPEEK